MTKADGSVELLIPARTRDLGGFEVRRLLPAPERRLIGPFIFFDHIGPAAFAPGQGVDVRPHPHIALATLTYLFEGELIHRDSLGSEQAIRGGDVNWMLAGRGIVHSERTGPEQRARGARLHGIQSWVALPVRDEEAAPAFDHHPADTIPEVARPGAALRIIAGSAYGATSPVAVLSPTLYVDARLQAGAELPLPEEHAERAAYVIEGAVDAGGVQLTTGTMALFRGGTPAALRALEPTRLLLVGGAPLAGPRHIWWNFVSSSPERIEQAKRDWKSGKFPKVPTDDRESIPLPDR